MGWGLDAIIDPIMDVATKFLADRSDNALLTGLGNAAAAAKPHEGWASGAASAGCVSTWQARLRELGTEVDNAADALTQSMDTYIDAQNSAVAELRAQAGWFER